MVSIDYMIYTRGAADDYDRWASVTGDQGWSWNNMFKYMLKARVLQLIDHLPYTYKGRQLENFTNSPNVQDPLSKYNPALHSTKGPLGAGLPQVHLALDDLLLDAQEELSTEFPFNRDVNSGDMIGFSEFSAAARASVRSLLTTFCVFAQAGRLLRCVLLAPSFRSDACCSISDIPCRH